MAKTSYIIARTSSAYTVVWVDDDAYQTTVGLTGSGGDSHTAFEKGTSDAAIKRLARHLRAMRYSTLSEIGDEMDMSKEQVKAARERGLALR